MIHTHSTTLLSVITLVFGSIQIASTNHAEPTTPHKVHIKKMRVIQNKGAFIPYRTRLLAKMIHQRYNYTPYAEDLRIAGAINRYTKNDVWPTPMAAAAIIEIESQYNAHAVSSTGAKGLMQISMVWQKKIPVTAYTHIQENIKYGVKMLAHYYQLYHGNSMAAILCYNSGRYAYNSGNAWPTYWWRFKAAKTAFEALYQRDTRSS